ncbi:hypothetical protein DFS34DRAFT_221295 [Phlyctochytrium arcticum]|nr:hypothetical protein DFS34DRAFT_221295 [Phlyctochytrium arcticum]
MREGNFGESSKQMEHKNLTASLAKLNPLFTNAGMKLHLTIDRDLQANKKLAREPLVEKHFADLPHWVKNVHKNFRNKYAGLWGDKWEETICKRILRVIFVLGSQRLDEQDHILDLKTNPEKATSPLPCPTDWEAIATRQLGAIFIKHLQGDHSTCNIDNISWVAETNREMNNVGVPNLTDATQQRIASLTVMLESLTKTLPKQFLITEVRITDNEAFHHKVNKRAPKHMDTPKTYAVRHALTVIEQNEGYLATLQLAREAFGLLPYSPMDLKLIEHHESVREKRIIANQTTSFEQKQKRRDKIAQQKLDAREFLMMDTTEFIPYGTAAPNGTDQLYMSSW